MKAYKKYQATLLQERNQDLQSTEQGRSGWSSKQCFPVRSSHMRSSSETRCSGRHDWCAELRSLDWASRSEPRRRDDSLDRSSNGYHCRRDIRSSVSRAEEQRNGWKRGITQGTERQHTVRTQGRRRGEVLVEPDVPSVGGSRKSMGSQERSSSSSESWNSCIREQQRSRTSSVGRLSSRGEPDTADTRPSAFRLSTFSM